MITRELLYKIYDSANIRRWNDKICPVELRELDKQAHKMVIAYVLGKFEEKSGNPDFDWIKVIEGGMFEFLQRTVLTDLKPQVFNRIKQDNEKYRQLNVWVADKLRESLSSLTVNPQFVGDASRNLKGVVENSSKLGSRSRVPSVLDGKSGRSDDSNNKNSNNRNDKNNNSNDKNSNNSNNKNSNNNSNNKNNIDKNNINNNNDFYNKFINYFEEEIRERETRKFDVNRMILSAAHFHATQWEFDIIERTAPNGFEIQKIKKDLKAIQKNYYELEGIKQLALYSDLRDFIDLCGQLRFQVRWGHLHRVPRTAVLGHTLIVAMLSYLLSLEMGACRRRCINNYFTGLFHDLPEVLTRDIINPVKTSVEGLDKLIKEYEREEMEKNIYSLLPASFVPEMKMFTENEFENNVLLREEGEEPDRGVVHRGAKCESVVDNRALTDRTGRRIHIKSSEEIDNKYNRDEFEPKDGELVKAADDLAAFMEAKLAIEHGNQAAELVKATNSVHMKYYNKKIGRVDVGKIYAEMLAA